MKVVPSNVFLSGYSGELTPVQGCAEILVKYNDREVLPLFVVGGTSPTLLGRNWIQALGLPVADVVNLHNTSTEGLFSKFPEVFSGGPGLLKNVEAKMCVPDGSRPRFFKPRPVPFSLQDLVTQELQRLEQEGILKQVGTSDWAAPIVPALKRGGGVRICGDFKVTVNAAAQVETYPIPRVEELWTKLSGGIKFSKLDLKDAYQQVVLSPASRKYVTINTHKGLFEYTRLPSGVSSAPAIFQRGMENLLCDLRHVVVYFDDILVTGVDDPDNMRNLEKVLQRLTNAGLKLKFEKCEFFASKVEYLGHLIDHTGLHPSPSKAEAPTPKDTKQLQSFSGLLNF